MCAIYLMYILFHFKCHKNFDKWLLFFHIFWWEKWGVGTLVNLAKGIELMVEECENQGILSDIKSGDHVIVD